VPRHDAEGSTLPGGDDKWPHALGAGEVDVHAPAVGVPLDGGYAVEKNKEGNT
jgi:hypothetical protein